MKLIAAWAFLPAASAFLPRSGPKRGPTRTRGVAFTIEMTARVDAPSPGAGNGPQQHFRNTSQYTHFGPRCDSDSSGSIFGLSPLREQKGGSSVRPAAIEADIPRCVLFREAAPARFACPLTSVLRRRPDNFSSGAWYLASWPRIEFSNRLHIAYRLV